jgi:hypothetical protein
MAANSAKLYSLLAFSFVHTLFLSFNFTVHNKKDDDLLGQEIILYRMSFQFWFCFWVPRSKRRSFFTIQFFDDRKRYTVAWNVSGNEWILL